MKQVDSKQRLFEVMSRLDKTFKPVLNEWNFDKKKGEGDESDEKEEKKETSGKKRWNFEKKKGEKEDDSDEHEEKESSEEEHEEHEMPKQEKKEHKESKPKIPVANIAKVGKKMNEDAEINDVPIKFRAEVTGTGENRWSTNGIEYDTEEQAKQWLNRLSDRWFGYDMSRVVPTTTPKGQPVDLANDDIYQNFRKK